MVEKGLDCKNQEVVTAELMPKLNEFGGISGLVDGLKTDAVNGINSSTEASRVAEFGENRLPREDPASIFALMLEALQDPTLILLMFSATTSIILGCVFECPDTGSC